MGKAALLAAAFAAATGLLAASEGVPDAGQEPQRRSADETATMPGPDTERLIARRIVQEETSGGEDRGLLSEYVSDQFDKLVDWFFDRVLGGASLSLPSGGRVSAIARVVIIASFLLILVVAALRLWKWQARARSRKEEQDSLRQEDAAATAADLRGAIEPLLARGRLRQALAAVWRYMMRRLAEREICSDEPRLTNREYVVHARRSAPRWAGLEGLALLAAQVDHGLYGRSDPERDDVSRLLREAERVAET